MLVICIMTIFVRRLAFLLLFLNLTVASAKQNIESVQLDYVPLDTSVECNRIFFKSSQSNNANTIYMIPKPILGTGVKGAKVYYISRLPNNKYQLKVNFYFPRNDESIPSSSAILARKDLQYCNYDRVKSFLNQNVKDQNQWITTITKIPVTGIQINIDGIKATSYSGKKPGSDDQLDIYDYDGKVVTAMFEITEEESLYFQSNLISSEGITAKVKFHFQARSRQSSISAKINSESLVQNLTAQLKGSKTKYISTAQFDAFLQRSVDNRSVEIISQNATPEMLSKITQIISDKVFSEIALANSQKSLPTKTEQSKKDSAASGGLVDINLAINVIQTKINQTINFDFVSNPESSVAQTDLRLQTDRLNDPNLAEIRLTAGNADPTTSIYVNQNQEFTISLPYWYTEKTKYLASTKYLSLSEIQKFNLANYFPIILSQNMSITNLTINGTTLAQGRYTPLSDFNSIPYPNKYRWKITEYFPETSKSGSGNFNNLTLSALANLPIYISFSNFGDGLMIKLTDLLKTNEFVAAEFIESTGQIVILAKKDLGTLRFRSRFNTSEYLKKTRLPQPMVEYSFEKIDLFDNRTLIQKVVAKQDEQAIVEQKTIAVTITRPKNRIFSNLFSNQQTNRSLKTNSKPIKSGNYEEVEAPIIKP